MFNICEEILPRAISVAQNQARLAETGMPGKLKHLKHNHWEWFVFIDMASVDKSEFKFGPFYIYKIVSLLVVYLHSPFRK